MIKTYREIERERERERERVSELVREKERVRKSVLEVRFDDDEFDIFIEKIRLLRIGCHQSECVSAHLQKLFL